MSTEFRLRPALATAALAAMLALAGCADPSLNVVDASAIRVGPDGVPVIDCGPLAEPSVLTDGGSQRPAMQWGCATYTNLAAQVANPQDLVAPAKLGPADGAVAAAAVRRYQTGRVKSLDNGTSSSSSSKAPSGGGSDGGSASGSTGGSN
ncbi:MAG: CpaD family pilus assembly lipoprotein [Burkholderia sp.]